MTNNCSGNRKYLPENSKLGSAAWFFSSIPESSTVKDCVHGSNHALDWNRDSSSYYDCEFHFASNDITELVQSVHIRSNHLITSQSMTSFNHCTSAEIISSIHTKRNHSIGSHQLILFNQVNQFSSNEVI
jgi:predicted small metal-binding protein